ncbi:hypothetical protein NLI96_g6271 [Meripilus lineatus]|uniref:F-box domain-containing protein n=1 Tax=Meripilus lineatus TaxID=2056292 RepID=A0AAD5YE20_9APHY|nr:hypothetical protein NLI96_g6271 [Physisporinus lineatus]
MFATSPGPPNRFRYLLDLQVDYDPTNPRAFDVPYLLLRATNLRRLSLHGVDELMECYPHVVDSLTNLVEFRCLDCTEGALEWLQRTSAPISRLQVMFWIGSFKDSHLTFDILPFLLKFANTLVSLELGNAIIGPNDHGIQFHNVREIKITMDELFGLGDNTPGQNIIQSFPNLEGFQLWALRMAWGSREGTHREHNFNVAEVARLGFSNRSLKELKGNIVALYRTGYFPDCAIENVELTDIGCESSDDPFLPVFNLIRPRILSLFLEEWLRSSETVDFLRSAFETISRTGGTLQEVKLNFNFKADQDYHDEFGDVLEDGIWITCPVAEAFLRNLDLPLKSLPSTVERLKITCSSDWDEVKTELSQVRDPSVLAKQYLKDAPSLKSVTLCIPRLVGRNEEEKPTFACEDEVYNRVVSTDEGKETRNLSDKP